MPKDCEGRNVGKCYVYQILVGSTVRYIGKGSGTRAWAQISIAKKVALGGEKPKKALKFHDKIAAAMRSGETVGFFFLEKNLTDKQAYEIEVAAIAAADPGHLWNITRGGKGGNSELLRKLWQDPEFRVRRVAAIRASNTLEKGEKIRAVLSKKWSEDPEFKKAQVEAMSRARWTPESREKNSVSSKAMWKVPGARERYGKAISAGQKQSELFLSVARSPQAVERKRAARKAYWDASPDRKKSQSDKLKNPEFWRANFKRQDLAPPR